VELLRLYFKNKTGSNRLKLNETKNDVNLENNGDDANLDSNGNDDNLDNNGDDTNLDNNGDDTNLDNNGDDKTSIYSNIIIKLANEQTVSIDIFKLIDTDAREYYVFSPCLQFLKTSEGKSYETIKLGDDRVGLKFQIFNYSESLKELIASTLSKKTGKDIASENIIPIQNLVDFVTEEITGIKNINNQTYIKDIMDLFFVLPKKDFERIAQLIELNFCQFNYKYKIGAESKVVTRSSHAVSMEEMNNSIETYTSNSSNPIGCITAYCGKVDKIPSNYLLCDGASVPIEKYPQLYAAIENNFGENKDMTFKLPNLKGRGLIGSNDEPRNNLSIRKLGDIGGEEKHILNLNELPKHNISYNQIQLDMTTAAGGCKNWRFLSCKGSHNVTSQIEVGGNEPHNVMNPYLVVNWIIRCK